MIRTLLRSFLFLSPLLSFAQDTTQFPVIAQIASGGPWRTTLLLVNTNSVETPFRLQFRDSAGLPLVLQWERVTGTTATPLAPRPEIEDIIPRSGLLVFRTTSAPESPTVSGYGQLVEGTGVFGQAIFQQRQPQGFDFAAASPLVLPQRSLILPFDNVQSTVTSAALVNPSPEGVTVRTEVRAESGGTPVAQPVLNYVPYEHRALPLVDLISLATRNRYGVVDLEASPLPVSLLGLRFSGPFTSFDPATKEPWSSAAASRPAIAQIVSGGIWETTLLLANIQPIPAPFRIEFRDSNAAPLVLPWQLLTPSTTVTPGQPNELSGTIPGGGIAVFRTQSAANSTTQQGFARLVEGNLVKGQAVFTQNNPVDGTRFEAASALRANSRDLVIPFDNVAGVVTSLALANPTNQNTTLVVRVVDADGLFVLERSIGLGPFQHRAQTTTELIGQQLANRRGVIYIVSTPAEISALGLRFDGPFTSFPVIQR